MCPCVHSDRSRLKLPRTQDGLLLTLWGTGAHEVNQPELYGPCGPLPSENRETGPHWPATLKLPPGRPVQTFRQPSRPAQASPPLGPWLPISKLTNDNKDTLPWCLAAPLALEMPAHRSGLAHRRRLRSLQCQR